MSKMGQALKACGDYGIARDWIRAVYWSRHHKTENARVYSKNKAREIWLVMDEKARAVATEARRILGE